ncbi:hypothetical protein HanIR_Chr11g0507021 [Helianthus annuus]|nr:hypothetical protein HanIR_Chr11g0507021 [Helianthus annuus]
MRMRHGLSKIIATCHAILLLCPLDWSAKATISHRTAGKNMRRSEDKTVHLISSFLQENIYEKSKTYSKMSFSSPRFGRFLQIQLKRNNDYQEQGTFTIIGLEYDIIGDIDRYITDFPDTGTFLLITAISVLSLNHSYLIRGSLRYGYAVRVRDSLEVTFSVRRGVGSFRYEPVRCTMESGSVYTN